IDDTRLLRPMVTATSFLKSHEIRQLEKLIVHTMGSKCIPELIELVKDVEPADRARLTAGKMLAQLELAKLQKELPEVIQKELERARFYFYSAHTLPKTYLGHDLTILKEGLLSNFQSVIDFIIHLLGASYWIEDAPLIVHSLHSKNMKIHSSAVETLEIACERSIFKLLYPLIGDLPLREKLKYCQKFQPTVLEVPEVLEEMETRGNEAKNPLDLIIALAWKHALRLPSKTATASHFKEVEKPFLHQFVEEIHRP
ncbi:MAG TPA: hypothetical protein VN457_01070, partial [Chlamydiales bacterium]|nr:hypothetical protein [Chlamydiales bacterium]